MSLGQVLVMSWASSLYLESKQKNPSDGALLLRFRFSDQSERLLCLPPRQWSQLLDAAEIYCDSKPNEHPTLRADYARVFAAWNDLAPVATPENMKPAREHTARNLYLRSHPDALILTVDHQAGPAVDFVILAYMVFFLVETIKFAVEEFGLKRPKATVQ